MVRSYAERYNQARSVWLPCYICALYLTSECLVDVVSKTANNEFTELLPPVL
jgi:hypothetical protein